MMLAGESTGVGCGWDDGSWDVGLTRQKLCALANLKGGGCASRVALRGVAWWNSAGQIGGDTCRILAVSTLRQGGDLQSCPPATTHDIQVAVQTVTTAAATTMAAMLWSLMLIVAVC